MKILLLLILFFSSLLAMPQTPDAVDWSPLGAVWVYKEFSATTNRNLQISFLKDTVLDGKAVKKMENKRVEFLDVNLTVRSETVLGFDYYFKSNDSLFIWEENNFKFIYDFSPAVGDEWITGTKKTTCPTQGFPEKDTITVDSIKQVVHGNRIFDYVYNNSFNRNYVLGPVIKNIGPLTGPYPFVNRNVCSQSSGFFQGLICYRDNIRGEVPMPNSTGAFCHSVITNLNTLPTPVHKKIFVYPNPVSNILKLKNIDAGQIDFFILNVSGQVITKGIYIESGIKVNQFKPGMYFLYLRGSRLQGLVVKFIKL